MSQGFVNFDNLKNQITYLLTFHSEKIETLPKEIQHELKRFLSDVNELKYSTAYDELYRWTWDQVKNVEFKMGTIGAQFKACMYQPCNTECVSGFIYPESVADYTICSDHIIIGRWDDGYHFHELNCVDAAAKIYLLNAEFKGFSREEKKYLSRVIGKNECMIYYSSTELLSSKMQVKNMPERKIDSSMNILYVISIFVLILVILIVVKLILR
jgi:hypothetical protein